VSFLRLMTFNIQLLPSVPLSSSPGNEAETRAYNVGTAIAALDPDERPDVIAFNEVFSEPGRRRADPGRLCLRPHNVGGAKNAVAAPTKCKN
jgi:hypothetical protein